MDTIPQATAAALYLFASLDPALLSVVGRSLAVSTSACLLAFGLGVLAGVWLAVSRFAGRGAVLAVLNTLLALPSVVVGLAIYLLLSRQGPLGSLGILFTPTAMVIAQSVLVVPLMAALTRRLLLSSLAEGGDQLRSLGAGPATTALLLLLHERFGLLTVLLTAFGRAVSEVGAVMIVGGNIHGVTRVMTTTIALETSKGDLPLALALGFVLLKVVGLVNAAIVLMQWRGGHVPVEALA